MKETFFISLLSLALSSAMLFVSYRARTTYFPAATWKRDEQPGLYWFGMSFWAIMAFGGLAGILSILR